MAQDRREYLLEGRLRELNPSLHQRFADTVFAMQHTLFRYQQLFPEFTDHSVLHSMSVVDFCNRLIGPEQLPRLNADAIYTLLMGCYLHDVGMGISLDQFHQYSEALHLDLEGYRQQHPAADLSDFVRDFHQELSAAFVESYADLLEIPSPRHVFAITQVCRGHRKTDLFDQTLFPPHWTVGEGNETYLPYLASLIRLADEIDVTAARNPAMLYDIERMVDEHEIDYHKRHLAVRDMTIADDAFVLYVAPCEPQVERMIDRMVQKMQSTLELCRSATAASTPFVITQERVEVVHLSVEPAD